MAASTTLLSLAQTALFRCSAQDAIASLSDGSYAASACNLFLPVVIDAALSAHPWRWARRAYNLNVIAGQGCTNPAWAYEFIKPADVVAVVNVLDATIAATAYDHRQDFAQQGVEFEEGISVATAGTNLVIWSQAGQVTVIYTSNAVDPSMWPNAFVELVTWMLAAELAMPLTSSGQIVEQMQQASERALQLAQEKDAPPAATRRLTQNAAPILLTDPSGVGLVNAALWRCGAKTVMTTLLDGSPIGSAASLILPTVIATCLSIHPWRFAQKFTGLAAYPTSSNPMWLVEYAMPTDCMRVVRIVNSTLTGYLDTAEASYSAMTGSTGFNLPSPLMQHHEPFEIGSNAAFPVIWSQITTAMICYTSNAIGYKQMPLPFLEFVIWSLAAELAVSANEMLDSQGQMGTALTGTRLAQEMDRSAAKAMQAAIAQDASMVATQVDYVPDWMRVRGHGPEYDLERDAIVSVTEFYPAGFAQDLDAVAASQDNVPNYLQPNDGLYGVPDMGIAAAAIEGGQRRQYIPAFTPDARIGRFALGETPLGWRRPYHGEIILGEAIVGSVIAAEEIGAFKIGDPVGPQNAEVVLVPGTGIGSLTIGEAIGDLVEVIAAETLVGEIEVFIP